MTILVTGASGHIGGAVLRELARARQPAVAGMRTQTSATTRRLDYDDPTSYPAALGGVSTVFLVAPPVDTRAPERLAPFIAVAAASGVRHVVVTSAALSSVDGTFTLRRIERLVEDSGFAWTHLRLQWTMTSLTEGVLAPMLKAGEFALPGGDGTVAFVHVGDVARVAAAVLAAPERHAGAAYLVTGPEAIGWRTVAELCTRAFGHLVRYRPLGEQEYLSACVAAGLPHDQAALLLKLFVAARDGHASGVAPTVRELTGREPVTLAQFLGPESARV